MGSIAEWSEDETRALRALIGVCGRLRKIDPLMTVTNAQTLLEVALSEAEAKGYSDSLNVTDLANRVDTMQSNMSRILRLLGGDGGARGRRSGLGLVSTFTDPASYRERRTKLTAQGRSLVRSILKSVTFH
jgi:DNA-binding MarR family transcriptional regulator